MSRGCSGERHKCSHEPSLCGGLGNTASSSMGPKFPTWEPQVTKRPHVHVDTWCVNVGTHGGAVTWAPLWAQGLPSTKDPDPPLSPCHAHPSPLLSLVSILLPSYQPSLLNHIQCVPCTTVSDNHTSLFHNHRETNPCYQINNKVKRL